MRALCLVCLCLLAGCVFDPARPDDFVPREVTRFALVGRLSVVHGERQYHVAIDWQHVAVRDEVLIATPLGQGMAEITRDAGGARLRLADRRERSASDWNDLAEQVFGFRLPLDAAAGWVTGRQVSAEGWRATVLDHREGLPVVLSLERDDIRVRLVIDEWIEAQ